MPLTKLSARGPAVPDGGTVLTPDAERAGRPPCPLMEIPAGTGSKPAFLRRPAEVVEWTAQPTWAASAASIAAGSAESAAQAT